MRDLVDRFKGLVPDWRSGFPAALVLAAGTLRLIYLLESRDSPFFDAPVVDAQTYLEQARRIAGGDLLDGDLPFWQPPLFPYFLALFQALFGDGVFVSVRLAQILLGAASCLILYRLAVRVLPRGQAVFAAAAMAAYGPLLYFEGELLPVALEVFLDLLVLLLLANARERTGLGWWLAGGIAGGLAAVTRPTILLFLVLVACLLPWLRPRPPPRRLGRPLLAAALGLACVVAPVTWRNAEVGGEFVLISANGGVNFYVGNNAAYDRTVAIHPGVRWERLVAEPLQAGFTSAGQRSDYFYRRAFEYIASDPLGWLGLLAVKTGRFLSGPEIKRNQDVYYAREHSRLLQVLLWDWRLSFPFGVVAPLALVGLAVTWHRRHPTLDLLRLFLAAHAGSVILFFVTSRYRVAGVPVMLVFAAAGCGHLAARWRAARWRDVAPPTAALALLAVVLNLPSAPSPRADAQLEHDLGEVDLRKERYEESIRHSRRALALEPDYPSAHHNLAVAYLELGQPERALAHAREALRLHPRRTRTRVVLARALSATGSWPEAIEELRRAVDEAPDLVEAQYQYGRLLLKAGRAEAALPHLATAARAASDYWAAYDLGRCLHALGRLDEALEAFEEAGRLDPTRPDAPSAAGAVALSRGDYDSARSHLRRALEIDPHYRPARINLGLLEVDDGRFAQAAALLESVAGDTGVPAPVLAGLARAYEALGDTVKARAVLRRLSAPQPDD